MFGTFSGDTGVFEGTDVFEGRSILVRFAWSGVTTPTPHWEQAFSDDGGETWETASARVAGWLDEHDEWDSRNRLVVSHGITGRILRSLYEREDPAGLWSSPSPPQDAVFRLWRGAIYRLDDGA